ncbi:MAG: Ppx/GppA family phosphatase [Candidatus Tectomicrobia bacterium]|uniref:Ppx/GppA family phosphatase n=1 Tax=Tectimicrobiota bacterium TaxID=2528274 RepID=A0A933LRV0_UNCTE|nr:Ppx/GppA family phosphatase [Candidatus Tectomicrobia bacterium]
MKRVAAIDIGTNTIRLLLAEVISRDRFEVIFEAGEITRLGERLRADGTLKKEAMERSLICLKRMVDLTKNYRVSEVMACATSALREARNRDEFLEMARREMGLKVEVISGQKEATLTVMGVLKGLSLHAFWKTGRPGNPPQSHFRKGGGRLPAFDEEGGELPTSDLGGVRLSPFEKGGTGGIFELNPSKKNTVIFDLGGGSTEFIFTSGSEIKCLFSLPLGVVSLAEEYLAVFPTPMENLMAMKKQIMKHLRKIPSDRLFVPEKGYDGPEILIGTGGSATTLAGIDLGLHQFDAKKINGHMFTLKRLTEILAFLLRLSPEERQKVPPIEKGREDLIVAGAAVMVEIMKTFNKDRAIISHAGLKEGMVAEMCGSFLV